MGYIYTPWNSPGHNTGVGSLSLLQWIFPIQGSNPGLPHCRRILYQLSHREAQEYCVGSLFLLQGIFPTQGSNPGVLHCRRILYQLSHKGSLRILEWVAYPFSRGSHSQTRRQMNKEIMGLLVLKGGDEPRARESGRGEASSAPLADDHGRASQSGAPCLCLEEGGVSVIDDAHSDTPVG